MTWLLVLAIGVAAWCLLPLPLAVAVGRAFRAGSPKGSPEPPVAVGDQAAPV